MTPEQKYAQQIVYQIFPERFAIGSPHTSASKLALPLYHRPGSMRKRWDELPAVTEAERRQPGNVFYGGDLPGVLEHLDYLQDLGVTTLYFTPLFTAPSNHKYDATDFWQVDPMFGGDAALQRLIKALTQRQMYLILDAVLNHVSDHHPWFLAARAGDPRCRDFFTLDDQGDYLCWWDIGFMPELNLTNPALKDLLYRGPDSVVQHYLKRGVAGWRFDTAQDLGMPIAREIRQAVAPHFPEAQLIGELMSYAGDWLDGSGYTGMMNYYFREAMLFWLTGRIGAPQASRALAQYYTGYGHAGSLTSWLMLASHDTARLATLIPQPWARHLARVAQFTLPGIPVIYYGEEIGMEGGPDPDCRRPMLWDTSRWDSATRASYRQLIAIRQTHPALQYGQCTVLSDAMDSNALIYLRCTPVPGEVALVVLNGSTTPLQDTLFVPYSHLYNSVPLRDVLHPEAPPRKFGSGALEIAVPAQDAAIYVPFEPYQHYRFYKQRNRPAE